jgi:hypothetical protein
MSVIVRIAAKSNLYSRLLIILAYIFSTLFHHYPFYIMAASWDHSTNTTYAYLHCRASLEFQCIPPVREFLLKTADSNMHPILLPVLIMDLETDATMGDDDHRTSQIGDMESETDKEEHELLELDLAAIVRRLDQSIVFLSKIERECQVVLLHLEKALKMISDAARLSASGYMITEQAGKRLIPHINNLVDSRKNLSLRMQNLEKRCQIRLTLVCL